MGNDKSKDEKLNVIDEGFVISSFKNKERRNNPSSEPRPLIPPSEKPEIEEVSAEKEITADSQQETTWEESKRKRSKSPDYESLFLIDSGIPTRSGKLVSIREKYHKRITRIVNEAGNKEVSIFSYIDNVLSHHFDTFQHEINEMYNRPKEDEDDYLIPKK